MFNNKAIARLKRENVELRNDLTFTSERFDVSLKGHEQTTQLLDKARNMLNQAEEALQEAETSEQALNEANQDLLLDNMNLSDKVDLYESLLKQLRVPVKLPARKK